MKIMTFALGMLLYGTPQQTPAVQEHVTKATQLAGTRYATAMQRLCSPVKDRRPVGSYPNTELEPVRVFDNLYFVGLGNVYAWAVNTPDGIIMLDSLNNAHDGE